MIVKLCALSDVFNPALNFVRHKAGAIAATPLHQLPTKPGLLMNLTTSLTGEKPRTLMRSGAKVLNAGFNKLQQIPQPIRTWGSRVGKMGLDLADALT